MSDDMVFKYKLGNILSAKCGRILLKDFSVYQLLSFKKIRLVILCESSARQTVYIKCHVFFLNKKKKNFRMLIAPDKGVSI